MRKAFSHRIPIILLLCLAAAPPTLGANLHFLALADTNDVGIGTVDDLNNAVAWAQTMASNTGLTLQYQSLSGANLTIDNTRSMINSLTVGSDDVIYFYYSGHGANPGNSNWPVLTFTTTTTGDDVSFDEVVQALQPKGPRLLIVLTDCCNAYPDQAAHPAPWMGPKPASAQVIENFRLLFVASQGSVLVSGCSPGQYSLGGSGIGGLFTNHFMDSIQTLAESETALTWDQVLEKTRTDTAAESALYNNVQEPQYVISTEEVLGATPDDLNLDPDANQVGNGLLTAQAACGGIGIVPLTLTLALLALPFIRSHRRGLRR